MEIVLSNLKSDELEFVCYVNGRIKLEAELDRTESLCL